jgi:uncharacterized protein YyaL (SSP411 family)
MAQKQASEGQKQTTNRLAKEKSPYLLQHATNPVDWYPWGPEAFAAAGAGGDPAKEKPIFLSIGYSTCHWCHVMERESFESPEVAKLLNDGFISIKVDREERPDIDAVYMTACQMLTGSGGWPLTTIMSPDQRPFFAATYLPRETMGGRIGMLDLLPRVLEVWHTRREEVERSGARLVNALQSATGPRTRVTQGGVNALLLAQGRDKLLERFDHVHGGFGGAPKFPSPHNLSFLLREWQRGADTTARDAAVQTLQAMRLGGLFDHLGYGFHRYSTDAHWLVPHFEKMLYDQALLMNAYTDGYQATGEPWMADTVKEIFAYLSRDLTAPGGAFFAAEDADSEGEEGRFYLWSAREWASVLSKGDDALFTDLFNIRPQGNYRDEASGETTGQNIPHLGAPLALQAGDQGLSLEELERRWQGARERLLEVRQKRMRPSRDEKVLADWNGLMIAALARAGASLNLPGPVGAARQAADFLLSDLRSDDGLLWHRSCQGEAAVPGFLEDYAYVAWGLLELYLATSETSYLSHSRQFVDHLLGHHWDEQGGGFFQSGSHNETLLARHKDAYDGALPSGNAVAALTLLRLAALTGHEQYLQKGQATVDAFAGEARQAPQAFSHLLQNGQWLEGLRGTIVVVGPPTAQSTQALLTSLRQRFLPQHLVFYRGEGTGAPLGEPTSPLRITLPHEGEALAYLCQNQTCTRPTGDIDELMQRIENML